MPSGVLVVGGGIAAQSVLEQVRERLPDVPVTLVSGEDALPYDRVSLSHMLVDGREADDLQLRPEDWYAARGIALRLGRWVHALDADAGTATLDDGEELSFDRAVLCTGSTAVRLPLPGADLDGVHVFRDPSDCLALTDRAGGRAVVIGGGLLGLEAAYGLASLGCPTTVVHLVDRLMERQLDQGAADLLAPVMAGLDVDVRLEASSEEILGEDGKVRGLRLEGGEELECETLVFAVGIRPQTSLAAESGLDVTRGIVVDDHMTTSHERVLAVGECAEHRGTVYGIVAPIHEQAEVAAATIAHDLRGDAATTAAGGAADAEGTATASGTDADVAAGRVGRIGYEGTVPSAKLKVMGVDLHTIGAAEGERAVVVADAEAGTYRKLVVDGGRAAGAVLLGDTRGAEMLLDKVRTGATVEDALGLLAEASQATAGDLPDTAQVCNCNGVCKGEIAAAISDGDLGSTQEVVRVTRAGAGCGSCKPLVTEILADVRGTNSQEPTYLCPCRKQTREELAGVCRSERLESVSELTASCGAGRDCGACKPGLAYLVSEVAAGRFREERHARYINDRVHANIQNDGTFSVVPRIRGGVVTAAQLRRIADVADKYEVPLVKLTGGQRIDLLGIRKEQLPAIWEELDMPSGHAYAKAVRTVKTCVGTDFCRFGLGDAMKLGVELETAMEGLYTPHKVKSAVTGCPRNCAEALCKDLGLVAVEGAQWQLYVGGASGASIRKGDLVATLESPAEALRTCLVVLQHYRETGEHLERTYDWIVRRGVEDVEAVLADEERSAALLERFRIAKAACDPDPWRERRDPVHPRQFSELDSEADALPAPTDTDDDPEPDVVGPPAGAARLPMTTVGGRR